MRPQIWAYETLQRTYVGSGQWVV